MSDGPPTRQELHRVLDLATADLRANPHNQAARDAFTQALDSLREISAPGGSLDQQAKQDIQGYTQEATDPGVGVSTAMGAANAMGAGLGDEVAGLGTALVSRPAYPGMTRQSMAPRESFGQAYRRGRDQQRAFQDQATAAHPYADLAGQIATIPATAIAGAATKIPAALEGGAQLGATVAQKLAALRTSMLLGGAEGGLQGFGNAEDHPVRDAALGATIGAGTAGAISSRLLSRLRGSAKIAAEEQAAALRPAVEQARIERDLASAHRSEQLLGGQATDPMATRRQALLDAGVKPEGVDAATESRIQGLMRVSPGLTREQAQNIVAGKTHLGNPPESPGGSRPMSRPSADVQVGEAQMPGNALHDLNGDPIPGSEVPEPVLSGAAEGPYSAEVNAARRAAATAGEAGMPRADAARAAYQARRAAEVASEPVARLRSLVQTKPTNYSRAEAQSVLESATPEQRAAIRDIADSDPLLLNEWRSFLAQHAR